VNIFYSMTIKKRLFLGFFLCVLFTAMSGGIGFISLRQVQESSRNIMTEFVQHLQKQNIQFNQLMPLKSLMNGIIAAENHKQLLSLEQNLANLRQKEDNSNAKIFSFVSDLITQKKNQFKIESDLYTLAKAISNKITEVNKLALGLADDVEFNAVIAMEDSKNNAEILTSKASTAISMIKASMLVHSNCKDINILIKDIISANESATLDYDLSKINSILEQVNNSLTTLPDNEVKNNIKLYLGKLGKRSKDLTDKRLEELAAKREMEKMQTAVFHKLHKFDTTMLQQGLKLKTHARKSIQLSSTLVRHWQLFLILVVIGAVSLALLVATLVSNSINKPLKQGVLFAKRLAKGDMSTEINYQGKDEIGQLADALNVMVRNLKQMIKNIIDSMDSLTSSSSQLLHISGQMSAESNNTADKANNVATAAEEMSTSMSSVATAMEQASVNVNTVASGTEEMSVTIEEIAKNAETAQEIAGRSVTQGKNAAGKIDALNKAASEIGQVTEAINAISSQTNLLALNATIEAARAGEAGKGFAVVANEIKDLAQQTAIATGEIAIHIKGIQDTTRATVIEINEISRINDEVDGMVSTIATAVDEQASTTREIAENIAQISQGINEVNGNVVQTTVGVERIAHDIVEVNDSASEMSNSSAQVRQNAKELTQLAEKLNKLLETFKISSD